MAEHQKWEYYAPTIDNDAENEALSEVLDEDGSAGWEFVCFLERHGELLAVFKRPIRDDDEDDD